MFRYVPGTMSLDGVGHDPNAKTLSIKNKSVKQRSIACELQVAFVSSWFWWFIARVFCCVLNCWRAGVVYFFGLGV